MIIKLRKNIDKNVCTLLIVANTEIIIQVTNIFLNIKIIIK